MSLAVVPNFVFQSRFISCLCGAQNNRVLFKKKKGKEFHCFFFLTFSFFFFHFFLLSWLELSSDCQEEVVFLEVCISRCAATGEARFVYKKNLFCSFRTTYTHTTYIHVYAQIYIDIYSDVLAHRDR